MRSLSVLLIFCLASACATPMDSRSRVAWGAGIGGVSGAIGGAALSPNDESRGLNALVFGLVGAVAGGLIGLISGGPSQPDRNAQSLREREREAQATDGTHHFEVPPDTRLPAFLKDRFRPAEIEEYTVKDSVSEDGELSEPHKVYRIKRPAELIAKPVEGGDSP